MGEDITAGDRMMTARSGVRGLGPRTAGLVRRPSPAARSDRGLQSGRSRFRSPSTGQARFGCFRLSGSARPESPSGNAALGVGRHAGPFPGWLRGAPTTVTSVYPANREYGVRFEECWATLEWTGDRSAIPGATSRFVVTRHLDEPGGSCSQLQPLHPGTGASREHNRSRLRLVPAHPAIRLSLHVRYPIDGLHGLAGASLKTGPSTPARSTLTAKEIAKPWAPDASRFAISWLVRAKTTICSGSASSSACRSSPTVSSPAGVSFAMARVSSERGNPHCLLSSSDLTLESADLLRHFPRHAEDPRGGPAADAPLPRQAGRG